MTSRPTDRPSRDDGIAEAAPAVDDSAIATNFTSVCVHGAMIPVIAVETRCNFSRVMGVAIHLPACSGLLEANNIGRGDGIGDSGKVIAPIHADTVVNIVSAK